ncbi:MAG TPA: phosphate ABC transporter substrate-binding protein [Bacteroidia bacterium]|jgi:phosphate transport system substrate-binding protein|nr:phosphate ABC transporter substrate-binding protein [Bacteroidia bacterium]
MKKALLVLPALLLLAFVNPGNDITVKGSDTVLPLSQKEAELFMKKNKDANITIVGGGSGTGITALIDGTTDIAMSSRDLKMEEKLKLKDKNIIQKTIAFDALAIIVNPANKVDKLTREQLEGIFTGSITSWKEVGGADEKIVVYSRESSSGTYEFMKEHVMGKKNYASTVLNMPATGAIVQSVGQTKGAIGYVGLAYLKEKGKDIKSIKAVAVSFDGKTFVKPSMAAAKDKTYPVSRPLYYIYASATEAKVKTYVEYIMSAEGQKTVEEVGYVPVK